MSINIGLNKDNPLKHGYITKNTEVQQNNINDVSRTYGSQSFGGKGLANHPALQHLFDRNVNAFVNVRTGSNAEASGETTDYEIAREYFSGRINLQGKTLADEIAAAGAKIEQALALRQVFLTSQGITDDADIANDSILKQLSKDLEAISSLDPEDIEASNESIAFLEEEYAFNPDFPQGFSYSYSPTGNNRSTDGMSGSRADGTPNLVFPNVSGFNSEYAVEDNEKVQGRSRSQFGADPTSVNIHNSAATTVTDIIEKYNTP